MPVDRHDLPAGWLLQRQRPGFFPCGSWPASEYSPAVMHVCRHDSPAGWLLQRQGPGFFPCGSWPASECSPAVMHVCRHDSPAGWLLQGGPMCFVFVGAGLPAIVGMQRASFGAPGLRGRCVNPQRVSAFRAEKLSRSTKATMSNMAAKMVAVLPMWNKPMWKDSICPRPPAPTTPSTAAARMLFSQR